MAASLVVALRGAGRGACCAVRSTGGRSFCAAAEGGGADRATVAKVMLATTDSVPGKVIKEYRGMAIGSTVRTKDMTKDITSSIRAVFGGELPHYTQLMADTREEAIVRLQDHASSLGANAVVSIRFTTSNIAQSASEVMAYG